MACFTAPVAEAVITTVITKVIESKEKKAKAAEHIDEESMKYDSKKFEAVETGNKIPFSRKMKWLNYMLWGGSALLFFEHVWHGEIVPWFPFLTAAANAEDAAGMLHEIATTGVVMALLITLVWLGIVGVVSLIEKRAAKEEKA